MASNEELSDVLDRQIWMSPSGDFAIFRLQSGHTVKGPAEPGEFLPGLPYRFFGHWGQPTAKYPQPSFNFVAAVNDLPHSRQAVCDYLKWLLDGQGTGIGVAFAKKIFDLYGSESIYMLRTDPEQVHIDTGHALEKLQHASSLLAKEAQLESTRIELVQLFQGKGFPRATIKECTKRWGIKAPGMIRRDAYLLMTQRIPGAGFSRCDTLYLSLGGDPSRIKRQVLAGQYGLQQDGGGHTWHRPSVVTQAIKSKVAGCDTDTDKATAVGLRAKVFASMIDSSGQAWLALGKHARNEQAIANFVTGMNSLPAQWPAIGKGSLSEHQYEQLSAALSGRLAILQGAPGVGKTYTLARLVSAIVARHGSGSVAICTPTGAAAVRSTEAMREYCDEGKAEDATTIHRLLKPSQTGIGTGEWNFTYGWRTKLPYPFVVIDEASMVDTDLMASLTCAINPERTHLLLIGDPYQLSPVGHGQPFYDMIYSGRISTGMLTEVRRNSGLIVDACEKIKAAKPIQWAERFRDAASKDENPENLRIIKATSSQAIKQALRAFLQAVIDSPQWDPIEDVQVICALNEQGQVSRKTLNPWMQQLLNPSGASVDKAKFRCGDKVICTKNDWYPATTDFIGANSDGDGDGNGSKKEYKALVYNGEIGRVLAVAEDATEMEFPDIGDGPRLLKIPAKGDWKDSMELGYAVTGHKCQGREVLFGVVIADDAADRVADRSWWYTSLSRAKRRCLVIGSAATVGRQCRNDRTGRRKTFLRELIQR